MGNGDEFRRRVAFPYVEAVDAGLSHATDLLDGLLHRTGGEAVDHTGLIDEHGQRVGHAEVEAAQRQRARRAVEDDEPIAAELVDDGEQALVWCDLNDEGDLLEKIIPDAVQVAGKHKDEDFMVTEARRKK